MYIYKKLYALDNNNYMIPPCESKYTYIVRDECTH